MELFRRIFFAAVLAGVAAGLLMAALQQVRVVPLILAAEHYEDGHSHDAAPAATVTEQTTDAAQAHDVPSDHAHEADDHNAVWAPADGFERSFYTILATTLVGIGFALCLAAISVLFDIKITLANGALWGLSGFLVFTLAPALGLPPELPGMAAGDLVERQIWWWGTALSTAGAVLVFVKFRSSPAVAIALALLIIPHIIGAPPAPDIASDVPAHLASAYAAATMAASMLYWLVVGLLMGWLNDRFFRKEIA